MNPTFSVCIPLFNGGATIEAAIRSVVAQEGPSWECIVVDDGSTDDSLVRAARVDDPRVEVRALTNVGLAANWSRAVGAAAGDLVLLLGQDDELLPGTLARLRRAFDNSPTAGMVAFGALVPQGAGPAVHLARHLAGSVAPERLLEAGLTLEDAPAPSQCAYRRAVLPATDPYSGDYAYCPEIDLQCRLGEAGVSACFLTEALVLRGSDPGRLTGRVAHTPIPLRDHYRLLVAHGPTLPVAARRQRRRLARAALRGAWREARHGRLRSSASFLVHLGRWDRRVRHSLRRAVRRASPTGQMSM